MTEQTFLYLTYVAMILALISLWPYRNDIRDILSKKHKNATTTGKNVSGYDVTMQNEAVRYARKWVFSNHGKKQDESKYYESGKSILDSSAYKKLKETVTEEVANNM